MKPITLQLFFIDGKPDGMLTAEVSGWTGRILMAPRTRLADALKRPESSYTGVYILLGDDEDEPLAYIGEGENIAKRIKSHDAKKDWWTRVALITSAENKLHKAQVQYLEARLVSEGNKAANTKLTNSANPTLPSLSEAAMADMESFTEQLLMILPAIRVGLFASKAKADHSLLGEKQEAPMSPVFELTLKKEGITATATLEDGDFVVHRGSLARSEYIGNSGQTYKKLYDKLNEQGVLKVHGDKKIFSQSYAFSSTSAAGAVCKGRTTRGRINWRVKDTGQTYKDWEAASLEES